MFTNMFSYVLSFFRSPNPELSIEEAVKILTETEDVPDDEDFSETFEFKVPEKQFKDEYNFSTNVGTITRRRDNKYIIDGLYEFTPDGYEFDLGDSVSYQKLTSDGGIVIYNVNLLNKDWDTVVERKSIATTRIMIGKVEKREKRLLYISPGEIKVDLDKTTTEFIPYVGDWLEIDVKYEVNEQSLDLSGQIIEVNKIIPIRPHIETGKISYWDKLEQCGTINQKIFFDINSLSCGYIPIVGDTVLTEVIESDQNKCSWRALKVLPKLVNDLYRIHSSINGDIKKVEENHPGLEISDCKLNFDKLGETKEFNVILTNNSNEVFKLLNVDIAENSLQLVFAEDSIKSGSIEPNNNLSLKFICTSKTMGTSNEFLEFNFEGFTIGKYVNVIVDSNKTGTYYQKNHSVNYQNSYNDKTLVIKGQKRTTARFQASKLPEYPVPKHLLDLVIKHSSEKDKFNLIEELKVLKRSLFTNLNAMNYEERFHTLLHLDEITNILCIRQYDQDRTCFIANNEFLMMEVENLAERRPSIVLGDKVMAKDPLGISQHEYEGNVFKVGAKHIYLKFSSLFHDTYKGEDYSVRVIPGRASYRRQHHAVYLVARNLGKEWLFPNQVFEKPVQVKFCYNFYPKDIKNSISNTPEVKLNASDLILKARKCKTLLDHSGNKTENLDMLKLEWYNRNLNCKQKDAIINILKGVARPLPYIIFGPPGTGKTVTLIESILQVLRMKSECRILVTAPSNSAADLVALRLINFGVLKPGDLVRLVSINYAVGDHIPAKLVPYCATGSYSREGTADENVLGKNGMTFDCSRTVLGRHKITVSTCSAAGVLHTMGFSRGHFTHIYVDEAGQAAEPEVMIPISLMDKYYGQIILAGDPMQLGPVILSTIANEYGLNESFLERLINRFPYIRDIQGFPETEGYDPRLVTKLLHNYRSLEPILNLFSRLFYHGELIPTLSSTNSQESQLLNSLETILPKTNKGTVPSIVFHGVEGENYQNHDSPSWCNPHEASQVFYYINELYRLGVKPENIGIITPYIKQVNEIKQLFREAEFDIPKTGTVEDFQGQEFDVVLLSTVRSTSDHVAADIRHSLGFVSSPRRLNVAISRPKALLVIIGNPTLLSCDTYWRNVIDYCMEHGAYLGCNFGSN